MILKEGEPNHFGVLMGKSIVDSQHILINDARNDSTRIGADIAHRMFQRVPSPVITKSYLLSDEAIAKYGESFIAGIWKTDAWKLYIKQYVDNTIILDYEETALRDTLQTYLSAPDFVEFVWAKKDYVHIRDLMTRASPYFIGKEHIEHIMMSLVIHDWDINARLDCELTLFELSMWWNLRSSLRFYDKPFTIGEIANLFGCEGIDAGIFGMSVMSEDIYSAIELYREPFVDNAALVWVMMTSTMYSLQGVRALPQAQHIIDKLEDNIALSKMSTSQDVVNHVKAGLSMDDVLVIETLRLEGYDESQVEKYLIRNITSVNVIRTAIDKGIDIELTEALTLN